MEKKEKIITTAIIVVAIVVGGVVLSFTIFKNEKSKFVGTWVVVENTVGPAGGTFTFYDNDVFLAAGSYGTYKVEGTDRLCLTDALGTGLGDNQNTICINYEFSNWNSRLELSFEGQVVMRLSKT